MGFYQDISLKVFERFIEKYIENFRPLRNELLAAGVKASIREYLSMTLMTSVITFMSSLILLSWVFGVVADNALLAFFTALSGSVFLAILAGAGFYVYPGMVSKNRGKKIEIALPFATTYMATISGSGAPPVTVFRLMAQFDDYGEFSHEIRKIVRDIEVFGYDLHTAIRKVVQKAPSEQFKDLMSGVLSTITSGANLTAYLQAKSQVYLNQYRRRLQEYSKQLSLYVEIYLTLIIVGSIFFMVLSAVLSAISVSGGLITMQFFIVFVIMPVVSMGFIYLLKATNPTEA